MTKEALNLNYKLHANQRGPSGEPLDDEVFDCLIEQNPKLIEECRQLREQMRAGKGISHEDVKNIFSL